MVKHHCRGPKWPAIGSIKKKPKYRTEYNAQTNSLFLGKSLTKSLRTQLITIVNYARYAPLAPQFPKSSAPPESERAASESRRKMRVGLTAQGQLSNSPTSSIPDS